MTGQIVIKSSPVSINRRQLLLDGTLTPLSTKSSSSSTVGEVAGGTAADCFVVCCCCPCVLFECLFLAVYKVPVNLCRRLCRERRRKMKRKGGAIHHATAAPAVEDGGAGGSGGGGYSGELSDTDMEEFEKVKVCIDGWDDAINLDKLMWDQFQNAGFWRSPSQRFM